MVLGASRKGAAVTCSTVPTGLGPSIDSLKSNGEQGREVRAERLQATEREEEKDNAETRRAQRLRREEGGAGKGRVPKWEGRRGWKAKFTEHYTAFVMPCQVISYVVMIRTAFGCGVS